jgi:hypothetical protein
MNRQELKELFGTATELAHECLALYQATTPENRERAMRLFETETQLIRLWLIRLARIHPQAYDRLSYFYEWLRSL